MRERDRENNKLQSIYGDAKMYGFTVAQHFLTNADFYSRNKYVLLNYECCSKAIVA